MMILSAIGITQEIILDFCGDPFYTSNVVLSDLDTVFIPLNVCYTTTVIFTVVFFL